MAVKSGCNCFHTSQPPANVLPWPKFARQPNDTSNNWLVRAQNTTNSAELVLLHEIRSIHKFVHSNFIPEQAKPWHPFLFIHSNNKSSVAHLVKRFIIVFTKASHLTLSQLSLVHILTPCFDDNRFLHRPSICV
jgi:hypothetical protein